MNTTDWIERTAARIDDGWLDILEGQRRLSEINLPTEPLPPFGPHELADRLQHEDGLDILQLSREAVTRDAEIAAHARAFDTLKVAQYTLNQRRAVWRTNHQKDLCAALQEERLIVQQQTRPLVKDLAQLGDVTDLGKFPTLGSAFAALTEQIAIWDGLTQLHRQITGIDPREGDWDTTHGIWPGLQFIARYMDAWTDFWRFKTHRRQHDGSEAGDVPPDWSTATVLDTARTIARFELWTPTKQEYDEAADHLTTAAHAQHLRADREYTRVAEAGYPTAGKPSTAGIHYREPEPIPEHLGSVR